MNDTTKYAITTLIAVVTIVVGFIQFGSTYGRSVQQPFLQTQTDKCFLASENAARLASSVDTVTWSKAREDFWMLYFGPLAIVEDVEPNAEAGNVGDVQSAMVAFGRELKNTGLTPALPLPALEQKSLDIAHACRDLLVSRLRVGLQGLSAR